MARNGGTFHLPMIYNARYCLQDSKTSWPDPAHQCMAMHDGETSILVEVFPAVATYDSTHQRIGAPKRPKTSRSAPLGPGGPKSTSICLCPSCSSPSMAAATQDPGKMTETWQVPLTPGHWPWERQIPLQWPCHCGQPGHQVRQVNSSCPTYPWLLVTYIIGKCKTPNSLRNHPPCYHSSRQHDDAFPLTHPEWNPNDPAGKEQLKVYYQILMGGLHEAAR